MYDCNFFSTISNKWLIYFESTEMHIFKYFTYFLQAQLLITFAPLIPVTNLSIDLAAFVFIYRFQIITQHRYYNYFKVIRFGQSIS